MMKTCKDCGATKPIAEFPTSNGKHIARCRPCKLAYDRVYYAKKNTSIKERRKVTRKDKNDRARLYILAYLKAHPCESCGERDTVVLEFDHRDPKTKKYNVSEMPGRNCSIATIAAEIAKCDVLCANCHRRKTAKQFGYRSYSFPTGANWDDLVSQFNSWEEVTTAFSNWKELQAEVIPSDPSEEWILRNEM